MSENNFSLYTNNIIRDYLEYAIKTSHRQTCKGECECPCHKIPSPKILWSDQR